MAGLFLEFENNADLKSDAHYNLMKSGQLKLPETNYSDHQKTSVNRPEFDQVY